MVYWGSHHKCHRSRCNIIMPDDRPDAAASTRDLLSRQRRAGWVGVGWVVGAGICQSVPVDVLFTAPRKQSSIHQVDLTAGQSAFIFTPTPSLGPRQPPLAPAHPAPVGTGRPRGESPHPPTDCEEAPARESF